MPEYLRPGVYIQETSYRGKPIQGVSTSTAGFVGAARTGPEGKATFVSSYAHFRRLFGDPIASAVGKGDYLGHSVKAFFDNGGSRAYVVRVLGPGAAASEIPMDEGTVLRLANGVTVRGPTTSLPLNSLRQVGVGSTLEIFTRAGESAAFTLWRTVFVAAVDPQRNSVTVPANVILGGVTLEPDNTMIRVAGAAPTTDTGPVFRARHRGADGDAIAITIRPRDRAPVALVAGAATRVDPSIPLAVAAAAGDVTLGFSAGAMRHLRVGDQITVAADDATITAIADGDATVSTVSGLAGADHSGAGTTISLISRAGTALGTPLALGAGAAPAAFALDMSGGPGPFGPTAVPHDLAMLLRVGDVVQVDTGGVMTDVNVDAIRVAEEHTPGVAHVTIDTALSTAAAVSAATRLRSAAAPAPGDVSRLYVNSVSSFVAPNRAASLEPVSIRSAAGFAAGQIALVDVNTSALFIAQAAGEFPTAAVDGTSWMTVDGLQAAVNGDVTLRLASTASFYSGAKVELDRAGTKSEHTVAAVDGGARTVTLGAPLALAAPIDLPADPAARNVFLRTHEIDITVMQNAIVAEVFEGLTWNADQSTDAGLRYFAERINDSEVGSELVEVVMPVAGGGAGFANAPATVDGFPKALANGNNGGAINDLALIGSDNGPGQRTGIQALAERDDISMVAVPGETAETVQGALITHCEKLLYRIAVLDAPVTALDVTALQSHRNNYDSKYAAYYAPWVKALNTINGRIESFPPSSYAMGIYARTDNTVGVHKAPANEVVRNITDLVLPFTGAEQDVLNPVGVNLIRDLTPRGIRLWGARTISSDQEWKYVNIRRLFIYLEQSIDRGTQWVVFEPNSEALWAKVVETITSFLTGVWKSGALMGTTPEEGFFVTCDRTTMTQDDIDNGRLVCEIGIAPVAPAEFVIFKIGQFTATSS